MIAVTAVLDVQWDAVLAVITALYQASLAVNDNDELKECARWLAHDGAGTPSTLESLS